MALSLMYMNQQKYQSILTDSIKEVNESLDSSKQLQLFAQPERIRIATQLWTHSNRQIDIVYPLTSEDSQEREEFIFSLREYVVRANLPPITSSGQLTKNPMTAKQSLVLTGLGEKGFDNAVKAVIELQSRFASHLPVDSLQSWSPIKDEDKLCLELSNRYFTPDYLTTEYDTVSLDESIDPLEILRTKTTNGKHTEDNVVFYYEQLLDKNNK
ncbi:hypothetical protein BDY19DRAFT_997941 [Irpex rosettiformis]|uniref:Uncharacterized protein n=1 Tax=Irpex rosettiformis TaxID=378272 RepID=A0ACB8TQ54_9APHY|nr:hypothetical protein BDY19DRAFT_997941 [Irpex rosettiformis]